LPSISQHVHRYLTPKQGLSHNYLNKVIAWILAK
jgi:hypothetical protein